MRKSGVLLSVSSLPSKYGIGCFDEAAYKFVDDLVEAKQTYWQILPLGITGYGDSPYQSFSTFAGNPYFISLDEFVKCGYLKEEDLPEADINSDYVDYSYLYENRYALLKKAYENSHITENEDFKTYCKDNAWWLEDYALFMAIKASYDNQGWENWPLELRLRNDASLTKKRNELSDDINYHKFLQYYVWKQWYALKDYANSKGIEIIGDIPIYVAFDSSDVWGQPELFQLDPEVKPTAVAGVPPDGFSADGQLWGNPLYDWKKHKETGYAWWIQRIAYCKKAYDVVRIDHFRGFDEYFSIPYGDTTARCLIACLALGNNCTSSKIIRDSCSYNEIPVSACNLRKNIFRLPISSKHSRILFVVFEKSIKIYDLYSFFAKFSAIVDLPTRLAPSNRTAYRSE